MRERERQRELYLKMRRNPVLGLGRQLSHWGGCLLHSRRDLIPRAHVKAGCGGMVPVKTPVLQREREGEPALTRAL